MKVLIVHQNFPAQYLHLARHWGQQGGHQVVFVTQRRDGQIDGVRKIVYTPKRGVTKGVHRYLAQTEAAVLNGQAVARVALELKRRGFVPDLMLGHNGWGEIWYLKDIFPDAPLVGYFEFFYRLEGADVGFDPQEKVGLDAGPRLRTRNVGNLLGLQTCDWGQCPTQWQLNGYPTIWHPKLKVMHEGIDTDIVRPDPEATFRVPNGSLLRAGDEVVTYVARNLEPYRGFPSFMRSLPLILRDRPQAQIIVVGGDEVSYGRKLMDGKTYRDTMLQELENRLDLSRVHFVGRLPYATYLRVLQVSQAHVYLTLPFVLSWSMLEALAAGCVVIGSRSAPVEEVIEHGHNGFLADMFDPEEIARLVVQVLKDPGAASSVKAAARRTAVDRFDLKTRCLPQQLEFFMSVLQGRSAPLRRSPTTSAATRAPAAHGSARR